MPREKSPTSTPARKRAPRKVLGTPKAEPAFTQFVGPEQRAALIAEAAYFRAEKRGFAPGHETDDWLAAEAEVDALLEGLHAGVGAADRLGGLTPGTLAWHVHAVSRRTRAPRGHV